MAGGRGPPTRCRGTTVLAHWHTLGSTAPRKLYRGQALAPRRSVHSRLSSAASAAVRYFDTVDTRLISIRYGRRGTNCRMSAATHGCELIPLLHPAFLISRPSYPPVLPLRRDPDTLRDRFPCFLDPGRRSVYAAFLGRSLQEATFTREY